MALIRAEAITFLYRFNLGDNLLNCFIILVQIISHGRDAEQSERLKGTAKSLDNIEKMAFRAAPCPQKKYRRVVKHKNVRSKNTH